MTIRFYEGPATGQPHIYAHNVTEREVEDVLSRPLEDRSGSEARGSHWAKRAPVAILRSSMFWIRRQIPCCDHCIRSDTEAKQALNRRRKRKGT